MQSFDDLLVACIDESLSVLGNEPKQAVYHYLSAIQNLDRDQIPEKLNEFSSGLRKALGSASKVIERLILKKLFQATGTSFRETPQLEFTDYVSDAKRRFELSSLRHGEMADSARSKKGQVPG